MKVALVHDWLTGMRGGEKCLEVFCEIFPQADLYTLIYDPDGVSPIIKQLNVTASWIDRLPRAKKHFRYLLPLFPRAIEKFDFGAYDLVLSSSHCVAKGIFPHRAFHVAYVHAPMRYVWDQHDAYFGAGAPWPSRAAMALCRRYLQQWDLRSAGRIDDLIANSNNVAVKIKRLYGREAAVIHPPVDVERFRLAECQEPYYLIVSALVPYKKIDVAIEAFNRLDLPLRIAGEGPLRRKLEKLAAPNVEFLGWVSDEQLADLYASCQAVIFPGEEDFGIVPLEAQASGRPVIAYGKGGSLETVVPLNGAGPAAPTGIFFDELTPERLVAAVRAYRQNRDRFDPAAIRRHSCRFSRDRFKVEIRNYLATRARKRGLGELGDVKAP
jgi:glycosyltransferase involved in cell wall biosynthesis